MTEKLEVIDTLQAFLDKVYGEASKKQDIELKRNHGHYDYAGEKFCIYVTIFPHEVELIFEGREVGAGVFIVTLDMCTSDGEILSSDIVSVSGKSGEIKAMLVSQEALVLAQLLSLFDDLMEP
ncbi:hypothetical protein [Pseudomonas purpurea]|uniref:hypothetical protein n=1 Tax=Pseudomonas purpurea TaxID=3136737 RepID=UPI003266AD33